jgi:hypothetical protein
MTRKSWLEPIEMKGRSGRVAHIHSCRTICVIRTRNNVQHRKWKEWHGTWRTHGWLGGSTHDANVHAPGIERWHGQGCTTQLAAGSIEMQAMAPQIQGSESAECGTRRWCGLWRTIAGLWMCCTVLYEEVGPRVVSGIHWMSVRDASRR